MRERPTRQERVLAIDPTSRGCCFAVLEGSRGLVDWGSKQAVGKSKNAATVAAVVGLIRAFEPHLLALEDCRAPGSRRCARVQTLIGGLEATSKGRRLRVAFVPPRALRATCAGVPSATKHEVAVALAERFPELARQLPPKRKMWMSEHSRMGIFDAVAMAVTALEGKRTSGRRPWARGDP